jgi:hypothetical protein
LSDWSVDKTYLIDHCREHFWLLREDFLSKPMKNTMAHYKCLCFPSRPHRMALLNRIKDRRASLPVIDGHRSKQFSLRTAFCEWINSHFNLSVITFSSCSDVTDFKPWYLFYTSYWWRSRWYEFSSPGPILQCSLSRTSSKSNDWSSTQWSGVYDLAKNNHFTHQHRWYLSLISVRENRRGNVVAIRGLLCGWPITRNTAHGDANGLSINGEGTHHTIWWLRKPPYNAYDFRWAWEPARPHKQSRWFCWSIIERRIHPMSYVFNQNRR